MDYKTLRAMTVLLAGWEKEEESRGTDDLPDNQNARKTDVRAFETLQPRCKEDKGGG